MRSPSPSESGRQKAVTKQAKPLAPVVSSRDQEMRVVSVTDFLGATGGEPLTLEPLAVLSPRREPYHVLIYQPDGTIHASASRIGHVNGAQELSKYVGMLQEAISRRAQLVVAPEYSVPWLIFDRIAKGDLRPPPACLWALGFESITPDQLDALRTGLATEPGVALLYEGISPEQRVQKTFLNPLVYVFWTSNRSGDEVLCILVQFKTVPCSDDDHVELRQMCLGTTVYKFSQGHPTVHLLGLICSDAFEFRDEDVDTHCADVLLLHIQLNKAPAHRVYAAYRARFCAVATANNAEILCVNWSAGVRFEGSAAAFNEIAGSAWYVSPRAGQVSDEDVNDQHHQGIYYSLLDKRWHVFYLNYSAHLVVIEKQPVYATGPQVLAPRLAPKLRARCAWIEEARQWGPVLADDGFDAFIADFGPLAETLPALRRENPLAVERALELLGGTDGSPSDWYALKHLRSVHVADEESMRRLTVCQETNRNRAGVFYRRERMKKARVAIQLPDGTLNWPKGAVDLSGGYVFRWHAERPHCNIEPLAGSGEPATLVLLGDEPGADELSNVFAKLSRSLRTEAALRSIDEDINQDKALDRLCIVYNRAMKFECYQVAGSHSISEPMNDGEDDIARGDL